MSQAVLRIVKAPNRWHCRCGREIPASQECAKLGSQVLCLECLKAGLPARPAPIETLEQYDKRILKAIEDEYNQKELAYQKWLAKRYEPKLVYGSSDTATDYPQYKWMSIEEDLQNRRQGNMIYQRGRNRYKGG